MNINNISLLKKALTKGMIFKVIDHQKKHLIGQVREVNKVQTNGLYSVIHNDPDHEGSKCNGGRGSWMGFEKAAHYEFGETVKWYAKPIGSPDNVLIMEFKIIA